MLPSQSAGKHEVMRLADVSRLAAQLDGVTERRREGPLDSALELAWGKALPAAQRASDPRQNNRHRCLGVRRQPACRASLSATSPARNTPSSPITIWIPQMTSRKLEAALSLVR